MNARLASINAKLLSWRVSGEAQPQKTVVNEIYRDLFRDDFYREVWDEPILLTLQRFIAQNPPNQDVFGPQTAFIAGRTEQIKETNNLFVTFLFAPTDQLAISLLPIAERLKLSSEVGLLLANGELNRIRNSSEPSQEKLKTLVALLAEGNPPASELLKNCLEALCERSEIGAVNGLLITQPNRVGMVLSVRTLLQAGSGKVTSAVATQDTFQSAVSRARGALESRGFISTAQDVIFSVDLTDATYSGSSITLAALVAMFSQARQWTVDPYTAFTGDINISNGQWRIVRVDGISEKLVAAKQYGIRRVVLPRSNEIDVPKESGLELIVADDLVQLFNQLVLPQHSLPADSIQQRKIFLLNAQCAERGWQVAVAREIQDGVQFSVTPPTAGELTVNIYASGAHTPKQHPKPEFQGLLQELNKLDSNDTPLQSVQQVFNLNNVSLRQQVRAQFEAMRPTEIRTEQYCDYSFMFVDGKEKLAVKQFSKGKLQLQGYAGPLYRRALEITIAQYNLHFPNATLNVEDFLGASKVSTKVEADRPAISTSADASIALPHIGTDESGKGDYFGPLVVAGVWVDESLQSALARLGVKDSKQLSDAQCQKLAASIREMCPGNFQVIEILPEKYNQLQAQLLREHKTLNHLLAWGHARAIESLLSRRACGQAIADQFGDEKYIESKLMEKGRTLRLHQTPKAERFIAVAAASVLARDHFLSRLNQLGNEAGIVLPKGASPAVVEAAKRIVQIRGADALRQFAKLHFKTTASVLGRT